LHCIEVSAVRHAALVKRYASRSFVCCYEVSSVGLDGFASPAVVERFYRTVDSNLRVFSLKQVLDWREQDVGYVASRGVPVGGIRMIKEQRGIDVFDVVLIDGSGFTAQAELREVYGARYVVLDDICTFKNYSNFQRLSQDPAYRLVESAEQPRNGYALFERVAPC